MRLCVCGCTGVHCFCLYGNRVTCLLCVCTRVVFAHVEMVRRVVCGLRDACVCVTSVRSWLSPMFLSVQESLREQLTLISTKYRPAPPLQSQSLPWESQFTAPQRELQSREQELGHGCGFGNTTTCG